MGLYFNKTTGLRFVLSLLGLFVCLQQSYALTPEDCLLSEFHKLQTAPLSELPPKFEYTKVPTFPQIDPKVDRQIRWKTELAIPTSRDQCSGACWANSTATAVEYLLPQHDVISANYIVSQVLLQEVRDVILGRSQTALYVGNLPSKAFGMTLSQAVPEEIYPSDRNVDSTSVVQDLNVLLKPYLENPAHTISHEDSKAVYLKALKIVQSNFGEFPKEFVYRGKKYDSPADYAARSKVNSLSLKYARIKQQTFQPILNEIERNLVSKRPVILGYIHHRSMLDPKTGRYKIATTTEQGEAHAVVVTGFSKNWLGKIDYLKIKNSHGLPDTLIMPISYLEKFGMQIWAFPSK